MRLRALRVANWRCIGKLELADIAPGITVLHGPNGTGKSSLIAALRCGLLDFAHNSKDQDLLQHKPWRGEASPHVLVEWEQNGATWRVRKTFSVHKDGESVLEEFSAGQWRKKYEGAREVTDRLRDIFQAETSRSGLYELLWLEQGDVQLPRQLGGSLQQQLFQVLGTMVTSRDRTFLQELDRRMERWFTQKKLEHRTGKKPSPVVKLGEDVRQCRAVLDNLEAQHREVEDVLGRLTKIEDDLPALRRAVEADQRALLELQREKDRLKDRLQEYRLAQQQAEAADKRLGQERARLQAQQAAAARWADSQQLVTQAIKAVADAQDELEQRAREVHNQQLVRDAHQAEFDKARHELANLEDQRRYLQIHNRSRQLADVLETARQLENDALTVRATLAAQSVPDVDELKALRENRRQAQELAVRLRAATVTICLEPTREAMVEVRTDDGVPQVHELATGQSFTVEAFQRCVLHVAGWGLVQVTREQNGADLAQAAQELAELNDAFARTLAIYQEDPTDPDSLERLGERRHQREQQRQRLELLQNNLHHLVPQGQASLTAELRKLAGEQATLLQRRPYLENWEPNEQELAHAEQVQRRLHQQFEKQLRDLGATLEAAKITHRTAEARVPTVQGNLHATQAREEERRLECERLGDPAALHDQVVQAEAMVRQAREHLHATRLRPEEEGLGARILQTDNALQQKQERVRQAEDELHRLRGRLEGSEGLHLKRADAEAALRSGEQALEREKHDAEAHKLLRELFEQCKENQVRQVMGPIAERVQHWARHLGLHDLPLLRFSDSFLPDGLQHPHVETGTLPLAHESYGTAEQLSLLIRLALGGILTPHTPALAVFDDPLAHTDALRRQRFLEILGQASRGDRAACPPAGPLQILIFTCHPEWFRELPDVKMIDLAPLIQRS